MNKQSLITIFKEYLLITFGMILMILGIYFFKFPNNFSFGGITGFSAIVGALTTWSPGQFTFIVNMILLIIGFLFLGKSFGIKTVYASIILSVGISLLEHLCPINEPLTKEPFLELIFAVLLPGIGSALLFNIGASSGGTDIIAMIVKKHTNLNIGSMLFLVDVLAVIFSFFVFGCSTGLFSCLGLLFKSLIIDNVIESINLCKCFQIISNHPEPICSYIINELKKGATFYEASGAYTNQNRTIILTTMKRSQALKLRNYVKRVEPSAFILIVNSSEIIGRGFLTN